MQLREVRRWQWIAAGLLLGAAIGAVRSRNPADLGGYERIIASRFEFEDALISEQQGVRRFRNLCVYPARLAEDRGGGRAVHIVVGDYFDGKFEMIDGNLCARWRKGCFIAEIPFRRADDASSGAHQTVLDYLDSFSGKGVRYSFAW